MVEITKETINEIVKKRVLRSKVDSVGVNLILAKNGMKELVDILKDGPKKTELQGVYSELCDTLAHYERFLSK